MLHRRAFLAACLAPIAIALAPTLALATGPTRQWYGHIPEGWIAIPVQQGGGMSFVPNRVVLVHQLNADGSIVPLYLVS